MKLIHIFGCLVQLMICPIVAMHLVQQENQPQIVSRYRLIDIGETEIDTSQLSKLSGKLALTLDINDKGFGIANTRDGGFVLHPSGWKFAPHVTNMGINFHAINNRGDLLISLARGRDSIEWMVWPVRDGSYTNARNHIHTIDPFKSDFFLTAFNDSAIAVGYKKLNQKNIPIMWSLESGLQGIGEKQGIDLSGIAKAINREGAVSGFSDEITDRYPFFWKEDTGLEILKNYRTTLTPKGWLEFADMVLTQDDTVYGTFWIRHLTNGNRAARYNPYHAYTWEPKTGKVSMLNLEGMRISGVNALHTLVGTLNGRAAFREKDKSPIELASLIDPEQQEQWQLLESTAINDHGQIIGYGTFQGKTHIFFADPI